MEMYPKILDFDPIIKASLSMTLARRCIYPMIISKGLTLNYFFLDKI
jgi:DNA excision repair protein ERCC-2